MLLIGRCLHSRLDLLYPELAEKEEDKRLRHAEIGSRKSETSKIVQSSRFDFGR